MVNHDQIWQSALGEIELGLSKANFTTWFKHTFLSSLENEKAVVCVPNNFTKAWLEKKYHEKIAAALKNVSNSEVKEIYYKIETKKITDNKTLDKKQEVKVTENTPHINRHGLNLRYTFENFIVGKNNELAHAASQAVAANPGNAYNPLFIYGGVGLGKTHLLQAVGHQIAKNKNTNILYVTCEQFTNDYIQAVKIGLAKEFKDKYRNVDLLLIDDIQFMGGKDGTQQEFFHTFNELHQTNRQIIITSDRAPRSIPALEKRLLSRFEWGMVVDIAQPDVETRIAILEAKCKEKKYALNRVILDYIANQITNNVRELEGALNRLIAFHEFNNSQPTVDSIKNILSSYLTNTKTKSITCKNILDAVSSYYEINLKDLIGKCRKKELVVPRQITMYLLRKELNTSYPTIGQELGGRDHTTAMHAFNKIEKEIKEKERIQQDIESIKQQLYNPC